MPAKYYVDPEKERFWRAEIEKWQNSGLSGGEFCRRRGHKYTLFADWRAKLRKRDAQGEVPEEVIRDRNTDWLSIILKARAHPAGVAAFCKEHGIEKKRYYLRFNQLRKQHPEWEALRKGSRMIKAGRETKVRPTRSSAAGPGRKVSFAEVKLVDSKTEPGQTIEQLVEIVLPNSLVLRVGAACSPEFLGTLVSALRNR